MRFLRIAVALCLSETLRMCVYISSTFSTAAIEMASSISDESSTSHALFARAHSGLFQFEVNPLPPIILNGFYDAEWYLSIKLCGWCYGANSFARLPRSTLLLGAHQGITSEKEFAHRWALGTLRNRRRGFTHKQNNYIERGCVKLAHKHCCQFPARFL